MNQQESSQSGFTIIELMLAMSFVAMLLLAIAMTTIQIGNIYNKGITLKQVNQAGRALSDELQRTLAASSAIDASGAAGSRYQTQPGGGRLCMGKYSYVWNTGKALAGGPGAPAIVNQYTSGTDQIRFAKVIDSGAALCQDMSKKIVQSDTTELLGEGDRNLVVHEFSLVQTVPTDPVTSQALYAITLTLGTNDRAQLATGDTSCKPPAEAGGDTTYCAVNTFDIIARAGNKAGDF